MTRLRCATLAPQRSSPPVWPAARSCLKAGSSTDSLVDIDGEAYDEEPEIIHSEESQVWAGSEALEEAQLQAAIAQSMWHVSGQVDRAGAMTSSSSAILIQDDIIISSQESVLTAQVSQNSQVCFQSYNGGTHAPSQDEVCRPHAQLGWIETTIVQNISDIYIYICIYICIYT